MTLPQPYILFNPPLKIKFCDTDESTKILGLWKYFDSVLIIHENGYCDIKLATREAVEEIEKKLNELTTNPRQPL
jgi:hypothetical protein